MKSTIKYLGVFFLLVFFLLAGCSGAKKFKIRDIQSSLTYSAYFNKKEVIPLKSEWKELYVLLKKGHILRSVERNDVYIHSIQLYKLIRANTLTFYETPFLQDYENFLKVFGVPGDIQEANGKIYVTYNRYIVNDSCKTCNHDLFSYIFDKESHKLLKM